MMEGYILETCVDSVESAMAAERGGANRLELCGNLIIGGTTPSPALYEEVRRHCGLRIHALIRPRFGDFCYTEHEFRIIRGEVKLFRELGADGVVIGCLRPDGTLNLEQMKALMEEAGNMSVTLHRAFDVCSDPYKTLEEAVDLAGGLMEDTPAAKSRCADCRARLDQGQALGAALKESGLLPAAQCRLMELAQRSGAGDAAMDKIAQALSEDGELSLEEKVSRAEPALVLVCSVLVGMILLSVMLPLMHIMAAIG